MKPGTLIFSAYILILSLLPCTDVAAACSFDDARSFQHDSPAQQAHSDFGEQGDDHCSSFCSCACCQLNLRQPAPVGAFFSTVKPSASTIPSYHPVLPDDPGLFDIWQPPRV